MRHIFLPLFVLAVLLLAGCAHKQKSTSRIYEGDGPGIHYTERQGAGSPVGTDRYH